jgi:hypothetical protein
MIGHALHRGLGPVAEPFIALGFDCRLTLGYYVVILSGFQFGSPRSRVPPWRNRLLLRAGSLSDLVRGAEFRISSDS